MTPQQIDAMKLALEALEYWDVHGKLHQPTEEAITAIREALAEHAMRETQRLGQEIEQKIGCVNHDCEQCKAQQAPAPGYCKHCKQYTIEEPLPPQRKPLTQDGTMEIANQTAGQYWMDEAHMQRFRAAVEAAHGIKENT